VARDLDGDSTAVTEVSGKFTGKVQMPSTLVVRGGERRGERIGFDVVDEAGSPVLTAGRLRRRLPGEPSSEEP
jgi:hypothetical protein